MYVDVCKGKIWCERAGESGPPVILIMGYTMSGHAWSKVVEALDGRCQVVTFDHAGVGKSQAPPRDNLDAMVDDVLAVLDAQGWDSAHVVGVSMGGMIAQHLTSRVPHRLRSLTLIATHPGGIPYVVPTWKGMALFFGANLVPRRRRSAVVERLLFPRDYRTREPGRVRMLVQGELAPRSPRETNVAHLRAVWGHRMPKGLPRVAPPTLILRPGNDLLVRAKGSDRLCELVPNARLVRLPQAGHGIVHQCPADVAEQVWQHVRRIERKGQRGREPMRAASGDRRSLRS